MKNEHYKVKLVQIRSNHQNLRTPIIPGFCNKLPTVGKRFTMYSTSLAFSLALFGEHGYRYIQTTEVKSLHFSPQKREYHFETQNSEYKLIVLDTEDVDESKESKEAA